MWVRSSHKLGLLWGCLLNSSKYSFYFRFYSVTTQLNTAALLKKKCAANSVWSLVIFMSLRVFLSASHQSITVILFSPLAVNHFCKNTSGGSGWAEDVSLPPRPLIKASRCPDELLSAGRRRVHSLVGHRGHVIATLQRGSCLSLWRTSLASPVCLVCDWGD